MSNLTAEQRSKLPESDFGDPKGRRFPILDQADVDAASHLIGRAKGIDVEDVKDRIVAICRRKKLTPPAAWVKDPDKGKPEPPGDTKMSLAAFAMSSKRTVEGDYAVYRGVKVFEAGEYEDVAISPEELWAMSHNTGRINGNLEHAPHLLPFPGTITALDGLLGHMENTRVDENDPMSLLADVYVPLPIDEKLPPERSVSVEFPVADRSALTGYALTTRPRANVDVLMSAYATFAGSRHSKGDAQQIQQIHDLAADQGAECKAPPTPAKAKMSTPHKEKSMSLKDRLLAAFSQIPEEAFTDSGDENPTPTPATTPTTASTAPVSTEPDPQLTALMSKVAQLEVEKRIAQAEKLVAEVEGDTKSTPGGREQLTAVFSLALEYEAAAGANRQVVTFSNGVKAGLVDALKAYFASQPAAVQLGEAESSHVLYSSAYQATGEKSDEEKAKDLERLLASTPLGKAALAARANGHKEN